MSEAPASAPASAGTPSWREATFGAEADGSGMARADGGPAVVVDESTMHVNYYFPVEVQVLDIVERPDIESIIGETLTRLAQGLRNL